METNKDAYRQVNQKTHLPDILQKNPSRGYSNEHSELLNKTRLVAKRQEELMQAGQQNIMLRMN